MRLKAIFISLIFNLAIFGEKRCTGENILFLVPISTGSESNMIYPLAKALALRGHQVTFVSPNTYSNVENLTEITPVTKLETAEWFPNAAEDLMEHRRRYKTGIEHLVNFNLDGVYRRCHQIFRNSRFQEILRENFDLIFINGNLNNCMEGVIYKLQAPFIVIQTTPYTGDTFQLPGFHLPSSIIPRNCMDYTDEMSFSQRVFNNLVHAVFTLTYDSHVAKPSEKIYRQYLGAKYPSMRQIEKNASMVFSNSHFTLTLPRPWGPDVAEIGGIHCREAHALPQDLEQFVSKATHGFIYFSMGSMFKDNSFSPEFTDDLIKVFARMKQRVLWRTDEEIANVSSNVLQRRWFPQQDVLGHPKIRLFITHGGIQSYLEASYHAVPLVLIPIWCDQSTDAVQAEKLGQGINLELLGLNAKILEGAVNKVLTEPRFKQKANEISRMFKDQPQSPLERAVYWSEYVIRHKGAHQLRSASRNLSIIQYHSLDVYALLLLIASLVGFVSIKLLVLLYTNMVPVGIQMQNNLSFMDRKKSTKLD